MTSQYFSRCLFPWHQIGSKFGWVFCQIWILKSWILGAIEGKISTCRLTKAIEHFHLLPRITLSMVVFPSRFQLISPLSRHSQQLKNKCAPVLLAIRCFLFPSSFGATLYHKSISMLLSCYQAKNDHQDSFICHKISWQFSLATNVQQSQLQVICLRVVCCYKAWAPEVSGRYLATQEEMQELADEVIFRFQVSRN